MATTKFPRSLAELKPGTNLWYACKTQVVREASYWTRAFRKAMSRDDLVNEGWLIVDKVLRYYNPKRGAKVTTLLTLALRQEFRRMVKRRLSRYLYPPHSDTLSDPSDDEPVYAGDLDDIATPEHPTRVIQSEAQQVEIQNTFDRLGLQLPALSPDQQTLLTVLYHHDGNLDETAKALCVTDDTLEQRVVAIRQRLKG